MNSINYNHLYNFFIVGQSGSLKAAAANLGLSQSTLSEQMKVLENSFHRKLLSRTGRSLNLTQEGRFLFSKIEDFFEQTEDLYTNFDQQTHSTKDTIEVGVTTSISRALVFQILKPLFQKTGSLIRITESTGDMLLMAFKKKEIDFFITHEKLSKSLIKNLKSISLKKPEMLLVGAGPFKHLKDSSPKALDQQPFFLFTIRSQLRWETEKFFRSKNINPNIKAEVDDPELIKAAVLNELGLAVLPEHSIHRELQEKKLTVLGSLPPSDLSIYAHYVDKDPFPKFISVLKTLTQSK